MASRPPPDFSAFIARVARELASRQLPFMLVSVPFAAAEDLLIRLLFYRGRLQVIRDVAVRRARPYVRRPPPFGPSSDAATIPLRRHPAQVEGHHPPGRFRGAHRWLPHRARGYVRRLARRPDRHHRGTGIPDA